MQIPCVYLPGPAPAVSVANKYCVLRNCSSAHSIYSSPHISARSTMRGGGRIWAVNTTHSAVPAGFHTYELDLTTGYKVLIRPSFLYNYFVTAEDNQPLSIPSNTVIARDISAN